MNRLHKTESAVFRYCRFSLFPKDPFFQIIKYDSQSDFSPCLNDGELLVDLSDSIHSSSATC